MYRPATGSFETVTLERLASPGEALFFEGDPCRHVYELLGGIARGVNLSVNGERQICAFFFAGDQIGLPLSEAYRFTVEAVTELRYVCHTRTNWHEAFLRGCRDNRQLAPSICAEHDSIFRRGIIIGRNTSLARLCAFLAAMVDRLPKEKGQTVMPLTQADIGAYLATAPESVCRALRHLRETGVIAMPRRDRLQVLDRLKLEAIANGIED